MAGFDAGSPRGGSCGTGCCQHRSPCCSLLAPVAMLSAFLAGACLSDGWLMNWGYGYLWERRIAYFTHVTVLIGKAWRHLVRSMYRHQIHKRTSSKIVVIFTDLSPSTPLSPGNKTTDPGISFWGRERGRKNMTLSLITFIKCSPKHNLFHTSTLTSKVSCTVSSEKLTILQVKKKRDLCSDDWRALLTSALTWDVCQFICFLFV